MKRVLIILLLATGSCSAAVNARSMNFSTSDGAKIHYFDIGSGPAIVFIPGWTMPADIWEPQINELGKRFRVIAIDPRSQGDSDKTADGNYLERRMKDVNELLAQLQVKDATLVGWSNGVPDVLTYIDQFGTGGIRAVVLVDGFVNLSDPAMTQPMGGMMKAFQSKRGEFMHDFVRHMYRNRQPDMYIQHVYEQSAKMPTNTAVAVMYNVLSRADYRPALVKIDRPVLYVCESAMQPQSKFVQETLPQARIEVFADAGHALFVDDAERFNKLVDEFVSSAPAPPVVKPSAPPKGVVMPPSQKGPAPSHPPQQPTPDQPQAQPPK